MELLLPVVYAELFGFPLRAEEIHRLCKRPLSLDRARTVLKDELGTILVEQDGFFRLARGTGDNRIGREAEVARAWETARRRARLIGQTPFVRGLLVTGSLAHDCFGPEADIDYLVLVAPRRIFTVFAVLGTTQRLTSVHVLCPNYYLATDHLALPERDYFIAREVLAATPVLGDDACLAFQTQNRWALDLFPNAAAHPIAPRHRAGIATRVVEWILAGRLGDAVEALLRRALISRIDAHYASCGVPVDPAVVDDAAREARLRFHARLHRERIVKRLQDDLALLGVSPDVLGS